MFLLCNYGKLDKLYCFLYLVSLYELSVPNRYLD